MSNRNRVAMNEMDPVACDRAKSDSAKGPRNEQAMNLGLCLLCLAATGVTLEINAPV